MWCVSKIRLRLPAWLDDWLTNRFLIAPIYFLQETESLSWGLNWKPLLLSLPSLSLSSGYNKYKQFVPLTGSRMHRLICIALLKIRHPFSLCSLVFLLYSCFLVKLIHQSSNWNSCRMRLFFILQWSPVLEVLLQACMLDFWYLSPIEKPAGSINVSLTEHTDSFNTLQILLVDDILIRQTLF